MERKTATAPTDYVAVAVILLQSPTVSRETVGLCFQNKQKGVFHMKQHKSPSCSRQPHKLRKLLFHVKQNVISHHLYPNCLYVRTHK